jgi:hypothetical protein
MYLNKNIFIIMETFKRKNITVECDYAKKGESFTSIVVKMKTFDSGTIIAEKRLIDSSFSKERIDKIAIELLNRYVTE